MTKTTIKYILIGGKYLAYLLLEFFIEVSIV